MNFDDMHKANEEKDDAKTATEHAKIILRYLQTGQLDRDDAIKKYKEFNDDHPDYYFPMKTATVSTGTAVYIEDERIPDSVIVGNLNQQLFWLTGKNLIEELQKTKGE